MRQIWGEHNPRGQSIIHCLALMCKWYVPWSLSPGRTAAPLESRRQLRTEKTMLQIRPFFCSASASYTKKSTEVRWWLVKMVVLSAGKSSWAQGTGLVFRRTLHYGKSRTGFPAHQIPKSYAGSTHLQGGIAHCPLEVQSSPKEGKPSRGSPHVAPPRNWPEPWKDKFCRGVTGVSRGMTHKDLTFVDILGKPGPGEGSTQKAPKSVLDKLRTIALSPPRREV